MSVANAFAVAALNTVDTILGFVELVVIVGAVLSWLLAFGIINPYNQFVRQIDVMLNRITEPLLRPIRRFVPIAGGIDLSPLVLLLGIHFVRVFIRNLMF